MTKQVLTVNPSNSVTECMRIMTERRVRHLPVLEGTKLVGILSMRDVVNWLMSAQKATIDNLLLDYHGLSPFEKFGRLSLLG
jgi:CBS domain-containing protein